MTGQKWGCVRDCMKKEVTEVDGRTDVLRDESDCQTSR
jgi:hypothetical protein